ncbi:hypothetical protein Anapl_16801 [Anas platyrhynchos]|uniref:Uncharacterized protein n=1 Tax=Anas platyrhynchos TaxID=8839 RepID=R0M2G3_ANAPL|nr:hypothetical protein Anapl_16801 [Anas platyrhynchos]
MASPSHQPSSALSPSGRLGGTCSPRASAPGPHVAGEEEPQRQQQDLEGQKSPIIPRITQHHTRGSEHSYPILAMQRRLVMCLKPVSIGNITLALIIFYDTSQHNGTYLEAMLVTPPFVKVAMRVWTYRDPGCMERFLGKTSANTSNAAGCVCIVSPLGASLLTCPMASPILCSVLAEAATALPWKRESQQGTQVKLLQGPGCEGFTQLSRLLLQQQTPVQGCRTALVLLLARLPDTDRTRTQVGLGGTPVPSAEHTAHSLRGAGESCEGGNQNLAGGERKKEKSGTALRAEAAAGRDAGALHESMWNGERSSAKRADGTDTRAKRGWERSGGVPFAYGVPEEGSSPGQPHQGQVPVVLVPLGQLILRA